MAKTSRGSPERFGYSWERFSELTPEQEEQFRLWTSPLDDQDWQGAHFLDVGCGAGRNSFWAIKKGAASGIAIDVDERSLSEARKNLAPYETVDVRFCSAYEIALNEEIDIAFSIGVIHHLDDPGAAISKMVRATKAGGKVLIWVYGYENLEFYVNVLNPIRKLAFSWMPLWSVRTLAYIPAALLWLVVKSGVSKIAYLTLLRSFPFVHLHHIVFDQMLPKIAHYWTEQEARELLEAAGLTDVKTEWVNHISWSVVGEKPTKNT